MVGVVKTKTTARKCTSKPPPAKSGMEAALGSNLATNFKAKAARTKGPPRAAGLSLKGKDGEVKGDDDEEEEEDDEMIHEEGSDVADEEDDDISIDEGEGEEDVDDEDVSGEEEDAEDEEEDAEGVPDAEEDDDDDDEDEAEAEAPVAKKD